MGEIPASAELQCSICSHDFCDVDKYTAFDSYLKFLDRDKYGEVAMSCAVYQIIEDDRMMPKFDVSPHSIRNFFTDDKDDGTS